MMALRSLLPVLVALLFAALPASPGMADGVPMPQLAKPKGDQCVEPTDYMRRNHMDLLKHQRDDTMHEGIRTKKYSWKGCVECHAATHPAVDDGKTATLYPFCQQCHEYAAVSIDCLDCHSEIPEAAKQQAENDHGPVSEDERKRMTAALQEQLERMQ